MVVRCLLVFLCLSFAFAQQSEAALQYDVIVVGSEPEGVAAAVAASESGAHTLLITEDEIIGGLFVLGAMNSLDLRTKPFNLQQGLFERWWQAVGRGHSFDVVRAEAVFVRMLQEAGVVVRTGSPELEPVLNANTVTGVRVAGGPETQAGIINALHIIDATSEMDFAAAAGAHYSVGFADLGYPERMVDTLVFRINGINWNALKEGIKARGSAYASVDEFVAWGHFGGYPAAYQALEEGIRLRGLNLGRQEDGSVLVNALLIHGIDPFDADSLQAGKARAEREAPRIIEYLSADLPGFENASFGGVAQQLYIRETRHLQALCTLSVDDVLNNRVSPLDVAAGGYPLDVQALTPNDNGYVFGAPDVYGVQLCVNVPDKLENLWVIGKAAGYDALAASSARVVPFGMALAEAVGVAAAQGVRTGLSPTQIANDASSIQTIRQILLARGAYLPDVVSRAPVGPYTHPNYDAYRLMLSRGLAVGGYSNDPGLETPMAAISYVYLLSNVGQRFHASSALGQGLIERFPNKGVPLSPQEALAITQDAACTLGICVETSWEALKAVGLVPSTFKPSDILTRGEMYTLAAGLAKLETVSSRP